MKATNDDSTVYRMRVFLQQTKYLTLQIYFVVLLKLWFFFYNCLSWFMGLFVYIYLYICFV